MSDRTRPLLSIGMIFKNEIRCLERCMKSLQPLREAVPCELVMADTGSDDGTRAIAEQYADILFDFPWIDDFAAARNVVIDRCTGTWFFSIDCDEWLDEDISELTEFLQDRRQWKQYEGCALTIHNYLTPALQGDVNDFLAVRLVRLTPEMRYEGAIHEHWKDELLHNIFGLTKTALHHDGYVEFSEELGEAKRERNMVLLRKALKENPQNLVTVTQCLESSVGEEMERYARMGIQGIEEKWPRWDEFGPPLFRYAVSVAKERKLPELWSWIERARELFPDSIFVRLDISYTAFVDCFETKRWEQLILEGETYLKALEDYRAWKINAKELVFGTLVNLAPVRENIVRICLANAYLEQGQKQEAWNTLKRVDPNKLALENVSNYIGMLMNIHAQTSQDTAQAMAEAWDSFAEKPGFKREMVATAAKCLPERFRVEETRQGYRHAYMALLPLEDRCELGRAARVLSLEAPEEIEAVLNQVEDWNQFSIHALIYALERGAHFPLPGKPLTLEEMDRLADRVAHAGNEILALNERTEAAELGGDVQALCWARALALSVVEVFPWERVEGENIGRGLAAARVFVRVERAFLPLCYAPEALSPERLFLLPPMHRFGRYTVQAFDALEAGDKAGYVRLLREGLSANQAMGPMVEFLLKHTPELAPPPPSAELLALADQVRTLLAMYPEDDPAVEALKASAAYQKVAGLIEGTPAPVFGGLPQ